MMCGTTGGFNCTLDCHIMERDAQTRPRKFWANETEKEGKGKFDLRKEECVEMMRIRHKTIRWRKRERWVDERKVD